ncbi:uncharacterized protein KQ657_003045 [Scheffersomyces spartinae]|uniref:Uncharacterized protein n=1 Tax=Scheffersomyces spartinae TaxID=45513 RepID=A0A9P7V5C3_9ASCO|nr:uncharacterized protein KQ657_003045 [Scheffersomyces spartinae]KAG7191540.1 hypothetical protein KQ657_003045 [Scheffersomyces spartinae]
MFRGYSRTLGRALRCQAPLARRNIQLSPSQLASVKGWGTIINIAAGAYIGGALVCVGSLYFMYSDANSRQSIPWELSIEDKKNAVKAINKDDVLDSPKYAVKHYRRLLIDLAKHEDPKLQWDEESEGFNVPVILLEVLNSKKSEVFANFYIDILLRYCKALLAKGQLDSSVATLKKVIDDDGIFFNVGDTERLSQCCRLLSRVTQSKEEQVKYLKRLIQMLCTVFPSIKISPEYILQEDSRLTDELVSCLNTLAFTYAQQSKSEPKSSSRWSRKSSKREELLNESLKLYLANLKVLTHMKNSVNKDPYLQVKNPLFNCSLENIDILIAEVKAHISEVLWGLGYKKNATGWAEEVVEQTYSYQGNQTKAAYILQSQLQDLITMYDRLGEQKSQRRCQKLLDEVEIFDRNEDSWYDSVIKRFSKIIYHKGPLGIIEKSLSERFGNPQRVLEIEEIEDEDIE